MGDGELGYLSTNPYLVVPSFEVSDSIIKIAYMDVSNSS